MFTLIVILIGLPCFIVLIDFLGFSVTGDQVVNKALFRITEVASMIILPMMYGNFGKKNECCVDDFDTAVFSPDHQITIAAIIILCLTSYFYSKLSYQNCSARDRSRNKFFLVYWHYFKYCYRNTYRRALSCDWW